MRKHTQDNIVISKENSAAGQQREQYVFLYSPPRLVCRYQILLRFTVQTAYRVKNSHGITFELTCVRKRGDCLTAQEKCQKCLMFAANKVY